MYGMVTRKPRISKYTQFFYKQDIRIVRLLVHLSDISLALRDLFLDNIHDARFRNSAQITQLVTFTCDDLAHNTTHDLQHTMNQ